jgi:nitrogen regulatory protein PII-like uncharacterized protein
MGRSRGGKVLISVYIPEEVAEELRKIIKEKYPSSTYGALSAEVRDALISWINAHRIETRP